MSNSTIVVGRIPVLECLRARKRTAQRLFLLQTGKGLEALRDTAGNIPVEMVGRYDLDKLSEGTLHQGVVLQANPLPVLSLAEWLGRHSGPDALTVILDGIEDPHNFGAIVRTASACGAQGVIFSKDHAAPLSPAALKSAAGAMEYIDLVQVGNMARSLKQLQEAKFWISALDPEGEQILWQADLMGRVGIVVGSEGHGIRRLVLKQCDHKLRIPLTGAITSLNASVSAAVALAECVRQRQK